MLPSWDPYISKDRPIHLPPGRWQVLEYALRLRLEPIAGEDQGRGIC
jgi:hypothetical protein